MSPAKPRTNTDEILVREEDRYLFKKEYEPIDKKQVTADLHGDYLLENNENIFEDFCEQTDEVRKKNLNHVEYFVHYREPEIPASEHEIPEPGLYKIVQDVRDYYLQKTDIPEQDRYVKRKSNINIIQRDIEKFRENFSTYEDLGLEKRRGALVYGPPGNGKSYSILRSISCVIENYDARVFALTNSSPSLSQLTKYRRILKDYFTIFIIEEITEFSAKRGSDLLRFLDGEWSWPNSYTIATTNYPGKLPNNLIDRPGRFDVLISMDEPEKKFRKRFLETFLAEDQVTETILQRTEGFSVAYLKELVLRSEIYDRSLEAILEEFDFQKQRIKEAFRELDDDLGFVQKQNENGGVDSY